MGIVTRMLRLFRADLHGVMDHIEDKQLLLKQYLREMETSLQQKETRLQQIVQTMRHMERDLELRSENIAKLEKDLDLALHKEKDEIARLLIRKQRVQKSAWEQKQRQVQLLAEEKEQLSRLIDDQRCRYDQLKIKSANFLRQAEPCRFEEAEALMGPTADPYAADDEEIELELMRRKDQIRHGGAA